MWMSVIAGMVAVVASGPRESVEMTFTTAAPATPAGFSYRATFDDPDAPALRRLIVGAPAGARFDTSVVARCAATDAELRGQGDAACPPEAVIGSGSAELDVVGVGRQRFTTTVFNADEQQLETVRQGEMVSAVVRGFFRPEGLDALIPTCVSGGQPPDGCPFDQAKLRANELSVPRVTREGRGYFVTPPTCPASRHWESPVVFVYADGVEERLITRQPCRPRPPRCTTSRRFRFASLEGRRLRSVVAVVRGRRMALDPRRPVLDLRGRRAGSYTIRIRAVTRAGRRITQVRRVRLCGAPSV